MTTLQNDLLEIYNSLVIFNEETIKSRFPVPIKVWYEKESRLLVFEQKGKSARLWIPIYYSLGFEDLIKPTYLLPSDYDFLMYNLSELINSSILLEDRTILSPENYGFDIYSVTKGELEKGPDIKGTIRFVSGVSWFFKLRVKLKYKL